ncbi:DUF3060 domain-containing protein [Mycolicibacterium komossense]|uniref:DUF3060 domain-containing protein n=1 Tax=Mycolicibacterium komossense TaxID=1779 RepID=A0ABT3C554_9MYCO|nr:DUF3060 domain-containing protein [Mycolicibacterium komossense]MCV7224604.1 DUF3060 domain-containing protein [Mycolicibacterium komossense]
MRPEDDPEARIRELERPLSDVARATELGVGRDTSGHPPPNRSRLWLVLAVIAVGLIAVAGGAVAYSTRSATTSGPPISIAPSDELGGASTIDTRVSTPGTVAVAPTPPAEQPGPDGRFSVSGIGENKTLACDESVVNISGVSNTVVITGHCASVQISGVSNMVTIDSAGEINASGIQNRITFHSGEPEVNNSGSGNTVEQG